MKNKKQKILLEVCANSVISAINAEKGGALRVELCKNLMIGGITPSKKTILNARENIKIRLFVLIRPREGNFIYSNSEFSIMKRDILFCKKNKIEGVVFGILNKNGSIDKERCIELIKLAKPMQTTFHRAFDITPNPFTALEDIISSGFNRILTSGQKQTALEGVKLIYELIKKSKNRIEIMPGGGINEKNISHLLKQTKAKEFHSSARQISIYKINNIKENKFQSDTSINIVKKILQNAK